MSGKYALTIDVIKHEIKINKLKDDYFAIQVTSPFRSQILTNRFLANLIKIKIINLLLVFQNWSPSPI